jgi:peptidoglycan/xylan/chitin deacetylase (PgdA/CDA1 family)
MHKARVPHGLMFHRLHRQGSLPTGQGSVTAEQFEEVLKRVGIENVRSPKEWMSRLMAGQLKLTDVCVTFDDGLRSQFDIALPVLRKHRLQAFWFLYSSVFEGDVVLSEVYSYFSAQYFRDMEEFFKAFFQMCPAELLKELDGKAFEKYASEIKDTFPFYTTNDLKYRFLRNRLLKDSELKRIMGVLMRSKGVDASVLSAKIWMNQDQLQELVKQGHEVGLHSYSHPYELARLSDAEQEEQYVRNLKHLTSVCGVTITSMSHPLNSYSDTTLSTLKRLGICFGFRSNMVPPSGKSINPSFLEMAREDAVNILKGER